MNDYGKQADPGSSNTDSLKQQGRDAAHDVGEAAQHQAESFYNQQRDTATEQTQKFTSAFRKMADEFDHQDQPYFSQQARKFADTADRFSNKLRDKDLNSICQEAKSFSEREPALFVGGAIAAGFLVTRFLRSSGKHSHSSGGSSRYSNGPSSYAHPSSGAYSSHESPTPENPEGGVMGGASSRASDPTQQRSAPAAMPGGTADNTTAAPGSTYKPGGSGRL